ncbi:class I SAM-dependent methyltransferase [Reinekea forsetii]|nr:class I SAM-dependent methyltransferase [Reinekea forsetii]
MVKRLKRRFKQVYRKGPESAAEQELALSQWYTTGLGEILINAEKSLVSRAVSGRFASVMVQLDSGHHDALFEKRLFGSGIIVSQLEHRALCPSVQAEPESLPFEPESVDMVLMHHTLDVCDDPYQAVREGAIALKPGGLLIVIGFNPFSLWGLMALIKGRRKSAGVWSSRFIRSGRVEDWMHLLNFELERHERHIFMPPILKPKKLTQSERLSKLFRSIFPFAGSVYLLVGYKQVYGKLPPSHSTIKKGFLDASLGGQTTARTKV